MYNFAFLDEIAAKFGEYIPTLIGALAILLLGWIVALLIAGVVRGLLHRTTLDENIASWLLGTRTLQGVEVERWIAKIVFYLVLLVVLVAFFETLGLTIIASSLDSFLSQIFVYFPRFIEAGVVLLLAWVVATALRMVTKRTLGVAKIDKQLEVQAGIRHEKGAPLAKTLGDAVYWLVFLLFLPALLDALGVDGLLGPVQGMTNEILNFLPNILAAGLLLLVGWFIARIVQRIAVNLFVAIGADHLSKKAGLSSLLGQQSFSGILGLVAYVLVLIPVLIAALNALSLDAVTQPASNMLNIILSAIPAVFVAFLIVIFAYFIGRVIGGMVKNLLANAGFDAVLEKLGVSKVTGEHWKFSDVAGYLVAVSIMVLALIEAFRLLGFVLLADLTVEFVTFASHIFFGLAIFAIGLYLASVASTAVEKSKSRQADFLALVAKAAILLFAGAVALRQMGVANEIINIAFTLVVGSVAVAIALALGLGGRDVAGKQLAGWVRSMEKSKKKRKR